MEQDIKANGLKAKTLDKEMEFRYGQMDLCMKDGG
jgi:hypothetical protein